MRVLLILLVLGTLAHAEVRSLDIDLVRGRFVLRGLGTEHRLRVRCEEAVAGIAACRRLIAPRRTLLWVREFEGLVWLEFLPDSGLPERACLRFDATTPSRWRLRGTVHHPCWCEAGTPGCSVTRARLVRIPEGR